MYVSNNGNTSYFETDSHKKAALQYVIENETQPSELLLTSQSPILSSEDVVFLSDVLLEELDSFYFE